MSSSDNKQSEYASTEIVTVIGFGRRLTATLIDGLLIVFLTFVLTVVIGFVAIIIGSFAPNDPTPFDSLIIISAAIVSIIYYVRAWAQSGQTTGKALLGMRVISTDGSPVSWGQSFLRYIGYIISGAVFSLGFLWLAFDRKRQGWHDKIARTYVIEGKESFDPVAAVDFVPTDPGRNWIWLVIWVVIAIGIPGGLLAGLWILGPVVSRSIANFLSGLL